MLVKTRVEVDGSIYLQILRDVVRRIEFSKELVLPGLYYYGTRILTGGAYIIITVTE